MRTAITAHCHNSVRFTLLRFALLLLFVAFMLSCARPPAKTPDEKAPPVSYTMLQGFPNKDSLQPEPPSKTLEATVCMNVVDAGGKNLDEMQQYLHSRAQDVMLCKTLDDPYLSKELFAKGDALPKDLRTQGTNCLRITNERYYNGKELGELCVQTQGTLIDHGCEKLHRVMATHSACASQKGTDLGKLKSLAEQRALREILAKEHPDLADAPLEDLKRLLSKFTVVTSKNDQASNTACVQVQAVYTPMAAAFYKSALTAQAEAKELAQKKKAKESGSLIFFLDLKDYDVGDLLPIYGDAIAVVQDITGTRVLGLNGATDGEALIANLVPKDSSAPPTTVATPSSSTKPAATTPPDDGAKKSTPTNDATPTSGDNSGNATGDATAASASSSSDASNAASQTTAPKASPETAQNTSQNTSQDTSQDTSQNASPETSKGASPEASPEAPPKGPQETAPSSSQAAAATTQQSDAATAATAKGQDTQAPATDDAQSTAQTAPQDAPQTDSQPAQQAASQPTQQAASQPTQQTDSQPTQQTDSQPTQQTDSQPTQQTDSQPTQPGASQTTQQASEKQTSQAAAQPQDKTTAQPPAKKMVHKELPQTVVLAEQKIMAFTMTVRLTGGFPLLAKPDPKNFSGGVEPLTTGDKLEIMEVSYANYLREKVELTLSRKLDGSYQVVFHLGGLSTNPMPISKPDAPHTYKFVHGAGATMFYFDDEFVKTVPSPGQGLVSVSFPFTGATKLYELQVQQDLTPQVPPSNASGKTGKTSKKKSGKQKGKTDTASPPKKDGSSPSQGAGPSQSSQSGITGQDVENAIESPHTPTPSSDKDQESNALDMFNPLNTLELPEVYGQPPRHLC